MTLYLLGALEMLEILRVPFEAIRKIVEDVIGPQAARAFLFIVLLMGLAYLLKTHTPAGIPARYFDYAFIGLVGLALVAVILGIIIPAGDVHIMNAFVSVVPGVIFAAIVGGAPYYLDNFQGVAEPMPSLKLMRVGVAAFGIGLCLGLFFGFIGRSSRPRRAGPKMPGQKNPDPHHRFRQLFSVFFVLAILAVAVWAAVRIFTDVNGALGATNPLSGPDQGDVVFFQVFAISAAFTIAFAASLMYLNRKDDLDFGGSPTREALVTALRVVIALALTGALPLWAFWRETFGAPHPASEVILRVLVLLFAMLVAYFLAVDGRSPLSQLLARGR